MKYFDKADKQPIYLPSEVGFAGMTWLERDYNVDSSRPDFFSNNSCAARPRFFFSIVNLNAADKERQK